LLESITCDLEFFLSHYCENSYVEYIKHVWWVHQVLKGSIKYWKGPSSIERVHQVLKGSIKYWKGPSSIERVHQVLKGSIKYWKDPSSIERELDRSLDYQICVLRKVQRSNFSPRNENLNLLVRIHFFLYTYI
jgi:hypothetical protein